MKLKVSMRVPSEMTAFFLTVGLAVCEVKFKV
jgi:hypothetical protein